MSQHFDIDLIVREVLKQIQQPAASRSVSEQAPGIQNNTASIISERVITATMLEDAGKQNSRIQIPAGAIITPAGRDVIKDRNLTVSTTKEPQSTQSPQNRTRIDWHGLIVQTSEPLQNCLQAMKKQHTQWSQELSNSTNDAIRTAQQELSRGRWQGVVITTDKPALACCYVNRADQVRGIVVNRTQDLEAAKELDANVVCIPARGLSFTEYRQILNQILN